MLFMLKNINDIFDYRVFLLFFFVFVFPRWGTADAEINVSPPTPRNTKVIEGSPFLKGVCWK